MSVARTIPTSQTPDVVTVTIKSGGSAIPATVSVKEIHVHREVNKIPWARIRLEDGDQTKEDFEVSNQDILIPGKNIEIQLGYRATNKTVFKGIIIHHSNKIAPKKSELMIECKDKAVKMTIGKKSKHYNDVTDSDVSEELIGKYSLDKDVDSTKHKYKDLVQYDTTDWDFMVSRSDRIGMICLVTDGKVSIKKPDFGTKAILDLLFGATIVEYTAEMDSRLQIKGVQSASWDYADQKVKTTDAAEPKVKDETGNIKATDLASVIGLEHFIQLHAGNLSEEERQAWADARLMKQRLAKVMGRVKFQGYPDIKPGDMISLNGVGKRFTGPAFVNSVSQDYKDGNWFTEVHLGLSPEWFTEVINPHHPVASIGMMPVPAGLTIGVVTDIEDPDGEDRVKVRLPMVSDSEPGVWARIASPDAGKERGMFFRPENGDEVIVGMIHQDPNQLVILGMLNSSNKPAPLKAAKSNDEKGYISRQKIKLIFNDKDKSLLIETPAGKKITVSDSAGAIQLEDENNNKVTMDSSGITINSGSSLNIKASATIKIEAPSISINGSAMTEVKGGIVKIN